MRYLKKLAQLEYENRMKKKINIGQIDVESPLNSPLSKSPISSISGKNKLKEIYDFSKKVNEFDNFSLGSSPLKSAQKKLDFKIDVREVEKLNKEEEEEEEKENKIN